MHELHEHLTNIVAERLKNRRVVTWYDPRREFTAYVGELVRADVPAECKLQDVSVAGLLTQLFQKQETLIPTQENDLVREFTKYSSVIFFL